MIHVQNLDTRFHDNFVLFHNKTNGNDPAITCNSCLQYSTLFPIVYRYILSTCYSLSTRRKLMTPQQHGRYDPLSFPVAISNIGIDNRAYLGHGYAQWVPIINSRHMVCHLFTNVERHRRVVPNVVRQRGHGSTRTV